MKYFLLLVLALGLVGAGAQTVSRTELRATNAVLQLQITTASNVLYFGIPSPRNWFAADRMTNAAAGTVGVWNDLMGRNNFTNSGTASPVKNINRLGGLPTVSFDGVNDNLTLEGLDAITLSSNVSIYVVMKPTTIAAYAFSMAGTYGSGLGFYMTGSADFSGWNSGSGGDTYFGWFANVTSGANPDVFGLTFDGTKITHSRNGFEMPETQANTLNLSGGIYLGSLNNVFGFYAGDISEVLIYDRPLSPSERQAVHRYLLPKYGLDRRNLIGIGDSLMFGTGSTISSNPLSQAVSFLGGTQNWQGINLGVSGTSASDALGGFTTNVAPFIKPGDVAIIAFGANDLDAGVSTNVVLANMLQIGRLAHRKGALSILETPGPRLSLLNPNYEQDRQNLRRMLIRDWYLGAQALSDSGGDVSIGAFGANSNAVLYTPDFVHMTNAGYAIKGRLWADAVQSLDAQIGINYNARFQATSSTNIPLTVERRIGDTNLSASIPGTNGGGVSVAANGNVGIGAASPAGQLEVYEASTPLFFLKNSASGATGSDGVRQTISGSTYLLDNFESGGAQFRNSGVAAIMFDSTGKVGLGTITPTERLSVQGNATVATNLTVSNNIVAVAGYVNAPNFYVGSSLTALISSTVDGVLLLRNNGASSFSRLQLGGTTATFPSLKRTLAGFEVVGADGTQSLTNFLQTSQVRLVGMTKAERDALANPAPVAGTMIYQTDNTPGLRVYNGANWMRYTETAD